MKIQKNVLNELILDTNQTIDDWNHWQAVLDKLCSFVNNAKGAITIRNNEFGGIDVTNIPHTKTFGFEPQYVEAYMDSQHEVDVWTQIEWKHTVGDLVVFHEHITMKELCKEDFYNHWLKPQCLTDGIAVQLFKSEEHRVVLNILHNDNSDNLVVLCGLLNTLIPHLRQAVALRMKLVDGIDNGTSFKRRETYLKNRFGFTEKEVKVATAMAFHGATKKLADKFSISEGAIKKHLQNIRRKMGVKTKNEMMAMLFGFVDLGDNASDLV